MSIRVYEYGLRAPDVNADLVAEQMKLGHRYRNKLTEIERKRREQVRTIMASHPEAAPLEAELAALMEQRESARAAIKATRKVARRRAETPEQKALARDLGVRIMAIKAQLKAMRQSIVDASRGQLEAVETARIAEVKQARHDCGVYWGTYLLHEAAADQARKAKTPPHFVSWRGEGRVGVQLQKGISLPELWGSDTQLHIDPVDPRTFLRETRRGDRRRLHRTRLRMRIGSSGRKPIWAEWPMFYHRPLPEGAVIKYAVVSRRRRNCEQWTWLLHLTVDTTACQSTRTAPATGAVALNIGFRSIENGAVRSGYLVGTDGHEQQVIAAKSDLVRGDREMTPDERGRALAWVTNGLGKASSIRSIRDRNLAAIQAELTGWIGRAGATPDSLPSAAGTAGGAPDVLELAGGLPDPSPNRLGTAGATPDSLERCDARPASGLLDESDASKPADGPPAPPSPSLASGQEDVPASLPEWLLDLAKYMHMWRSASRFRGLYQTWQAARFAGDEAMVASLKAWFERDQHLEMYEAGLRRSALADRRESYRIIAAQMAARYATLVIDDSDIAEIVKSPEIESDKIGAHTPVRNLQRIAAPGELRLAMINAFGPERTVKLPCVGVTRTCHMCGHLDDTWRRDEDRALVHECPSCRRTWDQDSNFSHNLLAAHLRGAKVIAQEKKPSRSERLHAARKAKGAARTLDA